ncbi:MAG TPA: hypothetical protein VJ988_11275 [Desulfobulbales bacterium]|nr:hypothetical protein [Desulfobulbales bacterium]
MRCPKCGFISFDHLTSCTKCGKDIAEVASELQGTSIKLETPMFLSAALAGYGDREGSFEEISMETEVEEGVVDISMETEVEEGVDISMETEFEEGVDISMEDEPVEQEAPEMAGTEADIDFSIEEDEAKTDSSFFGEKVEEAGAPVSFDVDAEVEEEARPKAAEKTLEDLDFMGVPDDDEGGLEFDLEDFLEDMDEDKPKSSGADDVDLDLDD